MFATQQRFAPDTPKKNAAKRGVISTSRAVHASERLIAWGNSRKQKLSSRAEAKMVEEERELHPQRVLPASALLDTSYRLHEDAYRMRKQRMERERLAELQRETQDMECCTFRPEKFAKELPNVFVKYTQKDVRKDSSLESYAFKPKINTKYWIQPAERDVYKRLYENHTTNSSSDSDTEPENNVKTSTTPRDIATFLVRQQAHEEERTKRLEELVEMYQPPHTPMLTNRTREICRNMQNRPLKQYIDLQDGRRNRTNSSAEVVKPAESLILQNKRKVKKKVGNPVEKIDFEAEEMSVKQKMQIFDNQPETETVEEVFSHEPIEPAPAVTASKCNKVPSKMVTPVHAKLQFSKQEQLAKNKRDRRIRLKLEREIKEFVQNTSSKNVVHDNPVNWSIVQQGKTSQKQRTVTLEKELQHRWNSSTKTTENEVLKLSKKIPSIACPTKSNEPSKDFSTILEQVKSSIEASKFELRNKY